MVYSSIFEALMLICFGLAWPVSIYKSYKAKRNEGKSIFFLYIILIGYLNGVIFQYLISPAISYVFALFFINIFLVATDIVLYYRNSILMKKGNNSK